MIFGVIILNQSTKMSLNNVTWVLIVSLFILKLTISIRILVMMLKKDSIHRIKKLIDHYLQERIKK